MKIFLLFLILIFVLISGCSDDNEFQATGEGLSMTIGNKVVLTAKDIDYYDLSTHFIYLKETNSFLEEKLYRDSFQIYANGEKIYSGVFHSLVSSSLPLGPAIYTPHMFYGNYLIPIKFMGITDQSGKITPSDPRNDRRIIEALRSHNQLYLGLQCEIRSVKFNMGNQVKLELELINNDSFNYYYLDPEKMGMGLFHYFTNGLSLWDSTQFKSFSNHVQYIQPEPYNAWKMGWLSLIPSHEKRTIFITYNNFDFVPAGHYKLNFQFPGLSHVDKKDLIQANGRIWLGDLDLTKDILVR